MKGDSIKVFQLHERHIKKETATNTAQHVSKGDTIVSVEYKFFNSGLYDIKEAQACNHLELLPSKKRVPVSAFYKTRRSLVFVMAE